MGRSRQSGFAVLLSVAMLAAAALALFVPAFFSAPGREAASDRALAHAREALIAFAAERPIDAAVGPGFLPCPDIDGDGWAEPICGSLAGDRGQAERLGRLPWKTLGVPDLRDGYGERLWYAVSTRYKGLLNCAASAACVDLTPATALGTITVRDPSGSVVHDGTLAERERGGAAALVIAPGPALVRLGSNVHPPREQRRGCAARCDPADYLDAAPAERAGEDNAAFHDRSDTARVRNGDGFIHGPVAESGGRIVVNDRIAVVTPRDLLPRMMRRVALEAAHCLSQGAPPDPQPACGGAHAPRPFGRLPDAALTGSPASCTLAAPGDEPAWWTSWRPFVFYAACDSPPCLEAHDAEGRVVASGRRMAIVVSPRPDECDTARLECDAARCRRVRVAAGDDLAVAIALP